MLRVLSVILLLSGSLLLVAQHLPPQWQQPWLLRMLPASPVMIGAGVVAFGALLLIATRRRPGPPLEDAAVRAVLTRAGMHLIQLGSGWQAEGAWRGVKLVVSRRSDYAATRFGRPWVLVARLPGKPIEPWPFMPDQALIAEREEDGFSVVMVDVCTAGGHARLAERLDRLVVSRA